MRITLTVLILSTILSGCFSQWVRNSANAEEFSLAKNSCEEQAESKFPVKNEVAQKTRSTQYKEDCKKDEDCNGKKYRTVRESEIESYVMDVNEDSRRHLLYQCMSRKGWKSETKWF